MPNNARVRLLQEGISTSLFITGTSSPETKPNFVTHLFSRSAEPVFHLSKGDILPIRECCNRIKTRTHQRITFKSAMKISISSTFYKKPVLCYLLTIKTNCIFVNMTTKLITGGTVGILIPLNIFSLCTLEFAPWVVFFEEFLLNPITWKGNYVTRKETAERKISSVFFFFFNWNHTFIS